MSAPSSVQHQVVARLKQEGACLASAESCTGGLVARSITEVAGSSEVFWGSWVVYDNTAKVSQLGVSPDTIRAHGAVSPEVARALAEGGLAALTLALETASGIESALTRSTFRICVSTTGIAGPGGGTEQKPVGLCYVAVAAQDKRTVVHEVRTAPTLDRVANQNAFAAAALEEVLKILSR